jgi:hypothetical protein
LASFEQELKEVLSSSPAIFCDETGMRVKRIRPTNPVPSGYLA